MLGQPRTSLLEIEGLSLVVVTADLSASLLCPGIQASVEACLLPEGGQ